MTNNLNSAGASFAKLGSNSFFEILPKSIVTENKCLRYAAMKRPQHVSFSQLAYPEPYVPRNVWN